jgi:hypothetical protein
MSLGVVIKGPEGVVLATDSRVTLEAQKKGGPPIPVNYDNATKLLTFSRPHNYVGCVTYGAAVIGLRTAHGFVAEFEQQVLAEKKERLTVVEYSNQLSSFFSQRWKETMPSDYTGPNMTFIVGGYDPGTAYGKVFLFEIPKQPIPNPRQPHDNDFGMTWGGQLEIASRLIRGFDPALPNILKQVLNLDDKKIDQLYVTLRENLEFPIPYAVLPLQDCIDLAIFLIRTTMIAQRLAIGIRGVGGPIDVAIITRTNGLEYVQQKVIRGERSAILEV